MNEERAAEVVTEVLDAVRGHPGVGEVVVPYGFVIRQVAAEEVPNPVASLTDWMVRATLTLPLIYSYTTAEGAHLPPDRSNLDELRALIEQASREAPARVRLEDWHVEPDADPAPKRHRSDPDVNWIVTAVFDVA